MRSFFAAIMLVASVSITSVSLAQAPDSLSFQGYVTDPSGTPIDNPGVSITFKLYEGSSEIWSETQPSVKIEGGVLNVRLGSVIPLDTVRFNRPLSLGIKVGGDAEISPRTPLAATAFARALPGLYTYYYENGALYSYNVVAGGSTNFAAVGVTGATIAGGGRSGTISQPNKILANWGTISGGLGNTVSGSGTGTIGGGSSNTVSSGTATIAGGFANSASGSQASIGGGFQNETSAKLATIGGGSRNKARGESATIPGGEENSARGYTSFAAGYHAKAIHDGTFVWNDRSITANNDSLLSTGANQFLIRAAGGVGIGTADPTAPFHVVGAGSSGGGVAGFGEVVSRFQKHPSIVGHTAISIDAKTAEDAVLYFAENGSAAWGLRHDNSGDLMQFRYHFGGVNVTVLEIAGDASNKFVRPGSNNAYALGTSSRRWTEVFATQGVINTSDRRLKRDIQNIDSGLHAVMNLRPVRFRWVDDPTSSDNLGLIAQEVEPIVPEVVRAPENDTEYYGLNYAELVPVLIKAIQEQQAKIDAQQSQIDELLAANGDHDSRLGAMEARLQP